MNRNPGLVLLVFLIFFVISLLTNVQGPLLPDIIGSFDLSLALAGFLPTSFFIAYGIMSIPAGLLIERFSEKPVLIVSFILAFLGSCLFVFMPVYSVALFSLFTIGTGMAMLQVAINPLLRVAGGEQHYAFNGVLAQLIFGSASFFSPKLYSYLVLHLGADAAGPGNLLLRGLARVTPPDMAWVSMYWIFTVVTLAMVLLLLFVRIPRVELKADEKAGSLDTHRGLLANSHVWLFFLGIFCYVGTEQGVANWMSAFLQSYHGVDPQTQGADAVAWFWGLMTAGCGVGLVLLKLIDSRKLLVAFGLLAAVTLASALFGSKATALVCFPLIGFWASIMWGVIFSLALNSVDKHHGSFAGILCTGIIGGAILPPLIGRLGDAFGLRTGLLVVFLTLGYIVSIGFWARPLVTNATVGHKGGSGNGAGEGV
jgi:FHS family L-fucose permease-like MFS transporter